MGEGEERGGGVGIEGVLRPVFRTLVLVLVLVSATGLRDLKKQIS